MKRDSAKKLLICSYKWFFCHDFANVIYSQTAKTVFSHLIIRFSKWCENEKQKAKFKSVFQCHAKTKNGNGTWIPFSHAIEKRLVVRYTHCVGQVCQFSSLRRSRPTHRLGRRLSRASATQANNSHDSGSNFSTVLFLSPSSYWKILVRYNYTLPFRNISERLPSESDVCSKESEDSDSTSP